MALPLWKFVLETPVDGFSLQAGRPGDTIEVLQTGFFTSDDGPQLYEFLDSIYSVILSRNIPIPSEYISNALINIVDRTNVTALINPPLHLTILAKESMKAGQMVYTDQIADIVGVKIPGFEFPSQGSIVYIFQFRWRRGLYFDLTPDAMSRIAGENPENISQFFGSLHTALHLRDRFRMTADVVTKMASAGWFPFTRLSTAQAKALYTHFENDWDPSQMISEICTELTPRASSIVESWRAKPAFLPHMDVLEIGAQLLSKGDCLAAASTILPKVEGVLRHFYSGSRDNPKAPELRRHLLGRIKASIMGYTALLPEAFLQYLEVFYYSSFNLKTGVIPPSRNSFLHGVGPDHVLKDPSYCLRLILTLDQIFYCLSRIKESANPDLASPNS